MAQDDKHNILFFRIKMFKATGNSFYCETVWGYLLKFFVFERVIFGRDQL